MTRTNILNGVTYALPSINRTDYNREEVLAYLNPIQRRSSGVGFGVCAYTHGATAVEYAYHSGVYSPTQNRIYMIPNGQGNQTNWHYIDCNTGEIVAYAHGDSAVQYAYNGGAYSPTQDRIYMVPYYQAQQTNWHYIDCKDGSVNAYAHGMSGLPLGAYVNAVYSPNQNRIYFVPLYQADDTDWHYIDCTSTGSVVEYAHGLGADTPVDIAYSGGCYSPTQDRIYFAPYIQGPQSKWHYIDCSDGSVVAYSHGSSAVSNAYRGATYVPTQNRIYFSPDKQADETHWHYVDCNDGSIVEYAPGVGIVDNGYDYGCYSPVTNRIYLTPFFQSDESTWHYIDCTSTGSVVVAYEHGTGITTNAAYQGSIYSPTQNRIYFIPREKGNETPWHYIQEYTNEYIPPAVSMAFG